MKQFKKTKLASAVGSAALAMTLGAPANAVVVGGDNGWEVSFGGEINAFYTYQDFDGGEESSRSGHSGFLPTFFTFKAKSPTVNGLTGTGQISFAPTTNTGKAKTTLFGTVGGPAGLQGASINTRENFVNVEGSFGTISYGETLSIFGRQAILKDMTLFGVGNSGSPDFGSVTAGRIGTGYTYPDFATRFSYKTPSMNGFQLEIGAFDPAEPFSRQAFYETDTPRIEGEITYATSFDGGSFNIWADFLWQEMDSNCPSGICLSGQSSKFSVLATGTTVTTGGQTSVTATLWTTQNTNTYLAAGDLTVWGVGVGAQVAMSGFELTGYYYEGEGLGNSFQFLGDSATCESTIFFGTPTNGTTWTNAGSANPSCDEDDNDGFYVQGTYTFNGKTKIGVSYGESNNDGNGGFAESERDMLSIGIYHDVTDRKSVV